MSIIGNILAYLVVAGLVLVVGLGIALIVKKVIKKVKNKNAEKNK